MELEAVQCNASIDRFHHTPLKNSISNGPPQLKDPDHCPELIPARKHSLYQTIIDAWIATKQSCQKFPSCECDVWATCFLQNTLNMGFELYV